MTDSPTGALSEREALQIVAEWRLPETGLFWDIEKTRPMSYESVHGSMGAREYMQRIARDALASRSTEPGGEGAPGARFSWLLQELDKRFADPDPFSAAPPEARYLAMLDAALASTPPPISASKEAAPAGKNMEGAQEFITALIFNQPIWPNKWGQDVAAAAFLLTDNGTRATASPASAKPPAAQAPSDSVALGRVVFRARQSAPDVEWFSGVDIRNGTTLYASPQPASPAPAQASEGASKEAAAGEVEELRERVAFLRSQLHDAFNAIKVLQDSALGGSTK
ncbi:MAG: hypothetical protein EOP24_26105 [Hyphomicrobiales bacterium]|nr:MAG: hypothetical protein EOP24_26105 [Hyphomicrobiales bacterium]